MSQPTAHRRSCFGYLLALVATILVAAPARAAIDEPDSTGTDTSCPPAPLTRSDLASLRAADFAVASDDERNRLVVQHLSCLGDPDPAVRDGVVYEATAKWLRAGALEPGTIRAMATRLRSLLAADDDAAGFRKPFAALVLSEVARADRIEPVLTQSEREDLVGAAANFVESVRDYRGFDPVEGWRHGVAHGADLVLQLGLHPEVSAAQVRRLLAALARQVAPVGPVFYTFGEPERLARAAFYLHRRGLLEDAEWSLWLASIGDPAPLASWSAAYGSLDGLARRHDTLAFLHALAFAARSSGDEAGARLAALADREIHRVMGG